MRNGGSSPQGTTGRGSDADQRDQRSEDAPTARRTRDPGRSRQAILSAAKAEFCQHGLSGARVERISRRSHTNPRMIYHYFGSKDGLYLAVLEWSYGELRKLERQLDLASAPPKEGIERLVGFTFDFFASRSDFIALIASENIQKAKYLKRLPSIQAMTVPLVEGIRDVLERGAREGVFRSGVDPVQLYVSIVAQSQLHISNRYTLSVLFDQDLGDPRWLDARRKHTIEMLLAYLTATDTAGAAAGA